MTSTSETITLSRRDATPEDIAHKTGRCVTAIRAEVAQLRAAGILPGEIYPDRAKLDKRGGMG